MMKKKRNPFLRRLSSDEEDIGLRSFNGVAIIETTIETDPEPYIEMSAHITTNATVDSPEQAETKDEEVRVVSPEKCPDDYSLFIVHNYVNGEITGNTKVVEDSLSGMSTITSSAGGSTEVAHCPSLYGQIHGYIPTEVRSFVSQHSNKEKVNNSLIDDDISAISFDKMLKLHDTTADESVTDSLSDVRNTKGVCVMAKEHMMKNILSVKYARRRRDRRAKWADDETFATLDINELESELTGGCCYSQQLDGIVMETGKAVNDWAGELEEYPFGGPLDSICDGGLSHGVKIDEDI